MGGQQIFWHSKCKHLKWINRLDCGIDPWRILLATTRRRLKLFRSCVTCWCFSIRGVISRESDFARESPIVMPETGNVKERMRRLVIQQLRLPLERTFLVLILPKSSLFGLIIVIPPFNSISYFSISFHTFFSYRFHKIINLIPKNSISRKYGFETLFRTPNPIISTPTLCSFVTVRVRYVDVMMYTSTEG